MGCIPFSSLSLVYMKTYNLMKAPFFKQHEKNKAKRFRTVYKSCLKDLVYLNNFQSKLFFSPVYIKIESNDFQFSNSYFINNRTQKTYQIPEEMCHLKGKKGNLEIDHSNRSRKSQWYQQRRAGTI